MRKVLDQVAPRVALITETNVPHEDNISYFGNGFDEAQMVYNFSLPPLVLNAFHTGNAHSLSRWAESLSLPSDQVTFFNFLASHDGIGVTPAKGILGQSAIDEMVNRVEALGGAISYKTNPDGSRSPYELNINYLDALGDPFVGDEDTTLIAHRFLASQAIMLSLRGVPGIYFHSLFGSRSWTAGMEMSGRARTINREKLFRAKLEKELADPASLRHKVFSGYRVLLDKHRITPAFQSNGAQKILNYHEALFGLLRTSRDSQSSVLCLHNVSNLRQRVVIDLGPLPLLTDASFYDLLSHSKFSSENGRLDLFLDPYQVRWLNLT
jgi:sucrose phosphorylase